MFARLKTKKFYIPLGFLFVTLASFVTFFVANSTSVSNTSLPPVDNQTYNYKLEKALLQKVFQKKSPKDTYELFKSRYQNIDSSTIHNLAHWIGTEIYNQLGMTGLSTCDEAFSYGCYHGFFIKAFEKEGKGLYDSGDKNCYGDGTDQLKYGGCIHGLGHGVLYLNGYDLNGLKSALMDCETLKTESSRDGCNNGVFMEYNTRTMQSLDSGEIRPKIFDPENPLNPCDQLEQKYQPDCYYELPAWWAGAMHGDYKQMAKLCDTAATKESQIACYGGVGRMAPLADAYAGKKVIEICQNFTQEAAKSICIEKAIEVLLGVGKTDSIALCDSLTGDFAKSCKDVSESYVCIITEKCRPKK